jgi:hypothetical protein
MKIRALAGAVVLVVAALLPGTAAAAHEPVPLKGTLWTQVNAAVAPEPCSIAGVEGDGLLFTIVTSMRPVSTLTHMGRVTLVQPQCVVATTVQATGAPASGMIAIEEATITAANGDVLTFSMGPTEFATFNPGLDPDEGPLPISFGGTITFEGGTGRFASAIGSAEFSGAYCFRLNGGFYDLAGAITR